MSDKTVEPPETNGGEAHVSDPATSVVLSIPCVPTSTSTATTDDVFEERNLGYSVDTPAATGVVPLSVAESSLLQNYVQNTRQWFVEFASGSVFWRLFVGSGFAVLIGAITLLVLGPSPEQIRQAAAKSTSSSLNVIDQGSPSKSVAGDGQSQPSAITLTVGTQENGGPVKVEVEDPFIESNRVTPGVRHAVYSSADGDGKPPEVIRQIAQRTVTMSEPQGPAWLSGTIEDAGDAIQPQRKHERIRPSHR